MHSKYTFKVIFIFSSYFKTSVMWASQNFLLYHGTIIKIKVNECINNLKNIYYVRPPLWGYIQSVQIITI